MTIDRATARRLARELISASVAKETPSTTLLELAELTDSERTDVTWEVVRHAAASVRMLADLLDIEPSEAIDHMAAVDWSQEE